MEINIKIKGTSYTLPEEVTASQWSMISLVPNDMKHTIAHVLNVNRLDLATLEPDELQHVYEYCCIAMKGLQLEMESPVLRETLDGMTFGMWVDLDVWAHTDPNAFIVEITSLLADEETAEWPLSKALAVLKQYLEWRANVYKNYSNLFGITEDATEEGYEATDEQSEVDIQRIWYDAIMLLCNDDFSNIDLVIEKPYIQALNFMAYRKEKAEKEARQMKQIMK